MSQKRQPSLNQFVELQALFAVLEDDDNRLTTIIEQMLPNELRVLAAAAEKLADTATAAASRPSTET